MNDAIDRIESALPNGFHDASLVALAVDYAARTATFDLDVDVSSSPEPDRQLRRGRLHLEDLGYLVVEPPDPTYPYTSVPPGLIDACETPRGSPIPSREGAFAWSFFVVDWNAFVRFEARTARFAWVESSRAPSR